MKDKVEIFGDYAHNFVPRVENLLKEFEEYSPEPTKNLVEACGICMDELEKFVLSIERSEELAEKFIRDLRKLACIAMAGHHYIFGVQNQVSRLANKMTDLYRRKNSDYDDAFGKSLDRYGFVASIVRMNDKVNRLHFLVCNNQEVQVKEESVADTFIDLANYAIMTLVWIDYKAQQDAEEEEE